MTADETVTEVEVVEVAPEVRRHLDLLDRAQRVGLI